MYKSSNRTSNRSSNRTVVEYIDDDKYIIDNRYFVYYDGNLYIYDSFEPFQNHELEKTEMSYSKTHTVKCKHLVPINDVFELENAVDNKYPLQFTEHRPIDCMRMPEYKYLYSALYRTSYVRKVVGRYLFALVDTPTQNIENRFVKFKPELDDSEIEVAKNYSNQEPIFVNDWFRCMNYGFKF